MLDPEAFQSATGGFLGFMGQFSESIAGVVALDGKTLHRSYDRAAGQSPLHLVSDWADEQRLVLGQVAVEDKSNEIAAAPGLLEMLSLRSKVVTPIFDQSGHALSAAGGPVRHKRMEQGGDYGLALKGNQGTLHDDVKLFLDDPDTPVAQATEVGKGHGRIENRLHWVLDVTCNEDQARNRKGHCAENLALLRKLALNLARLEPSKGSMRGKLKRAGWDNGFLINILSQFANIHMR